MRLRNACSLTIKSASLNFNWIEEEAGSTKEILLFTVASYASHNAFLYSGFCQHLETEPALVERAAKVEPL